MKHKIKITLPTVPYDHSIRDIVAYLQSSISELTGTIPELFINDFDFTSAINTFKEQREESHPNRIIKSRPKE